MSSGQWRRGSFAGCPGRHENRAGVRQTGQLAQQSHRHRARAAREAAPPGPGAGQETQGEIRPHPGLPQGLGPGLVRMSRGSWDSRRASLPWHGHRKAAWFSRRRTQKLLGLQGQVAASAVVHGRLLSAGPQDIVAAHDPVLLGLAISTHYAKI